ncbi:hypothetical protein R0K04_00835 [Pseudoalteromonas sp. SIMBA_153]
MTRLQFFLRSILAFLICLPLIAAAEEEFKQAYAPVGISGITVFVPIDIYPESAPYLTIKETPSEYLLQWTKSSDSNYYILEQLINGKWQLISNNILTNEYRADKSGGAVFRVKGCHQYGCAHWTNVNNIISLPLQITSFSTDKIKVNQGEQVIVNWDVTGASSVNLNVNGTDYKSLSSSGSKSITLNDYSVFEISASGFGFSQTQHLAVVVNKPKVIEPVELSGNLQPLMNLGLDIIERAILSESDFTYVATQDGFLHKINNQSQIIWSKGLNGVLANKPISSNGYLYYSVSLINGAGKICKTSMHSADTMCENTSSTVIASPIINQIPSSIIASKNQVTTQSNYFSSDANNSNSLLSVTTTGLVTEYNLETLTITNQFILPDDYRNNPILSDAKFSKQNELLLRTAPNQVTAFFIPSSDSGRGDGIFSSVQRFFSTSSDDNQSTQPQVLDIAWQKEL